jgi:hypothetical protein
MATAAAREKILHFFVDGKVRMGRSGPTHFRKKHEIESGRLRIQNHSVSAY